MMKALTLTSKIIRITAPMALILLLLSCGGNRSGIEPPRPVLSAFEAGFEGIEKVKWELTGQQEYRAGFIRDHHPCGAYFDAGGTLLRTETEILSSELPSIVVSTVSGAFHGSSVAKVIRIDAPGKDRIFRLHLKTGRKISYVDLNEAGVIMVNTIR